MRRRSPMREIFATLPAVQRGFVAVGQTPPGSFNLARDRAADISLMFALLIAAAIAGGSAYETLLFPAWTGSSGQAAGILTFAHDGSAALSFALGQFWLVCYSAAGASLLLALALNWGRSWRRGMLLFALAAFAAMRVWTYFSLRPEFEELLRTPGLAAGSAQIIEHVLSWSAQNRWRELADALVVVSLAIAFGAPAQRTSTTRVSRAAGAYRKASK